MAKKQKRNGLTAESPGGLWLRAAYTALTNGYLKGFVEGKIYRGSSKALCVPGLNCYSCPGALGACPIGSLQAVLDSGKFQFSCYVFGFLMLFGTLMGRFVCGWLCPFGLVQDLLHKIPLFHKKKNLPGHRFLRYGKYLVLAVFVILLPMTVVGVTGMGDPWFCKYICPSGTLFGGLPLLASNPTHQQVLHQFTEAVLVESDPACGSRLAVQLENAAAGGNRAAVYPLLPSVLQIPLSAGRTVWAV